MIETQLRALFGEMADGEPPSSGVDVELARRRGRTRLRWRRAAVAASSALAAVSVAATAATIPSVWHAGHRAPAAGPASPRLFNPLAQYLSFGWLPPGDSLVAGGTGQAEMYLTAAPKPDSPVSWELSAYATGQCKLDAKRLTCSSVAGQRSSVDPAQTLTGPAPTVHGQRAVWTLTGLAWQYARGGWAWLTFPYPFDFPKPPPAIKAGTVKPGTTRATVKREAIEIAAHVKFGAAMPLAFPAQFTGLPSQWRVSSATYVPDGPVLRVRTYALNAGPAAGVRDFDGGLTFQNNLPWVEIDPVTVRHNPCFYYPGGFRKSAREVINGYHVIVTREGAPRTVAGNYHTVPEQSICAANADGLAVSIAEHGAHPLTGVTALFKEHLRLLGSNPANWTSRPIG
jgi:hypothetical protein